MPLAQLLLLLLFTNVGAMGGEKPSFHGAVMAPNVNHRQNVCGRQEAFHNFTGDRDLRTALQGLQLNVAIGSYEGSYFNYLEETGIDTDYPGLAAVILDELAHRGGFTWRDSFGVYTGPPNSTVSWSEVLYWAMDSYDVVIDWWQHSQWRRNNGVAFVEPYVDSSIILIEQSKDKESITEINIWNWLRPYNWHVWLMTLFTIFLSGVVYQILEWFADERDDRTMWEWWSGNVYMSAINFTQAYEYQPKTFPSRIFGVSMAIWALVMTATYTANLASLLVDRRDPPPGPESLEEIQVFGNTVCIWEGTATTIYVKENFPSAQFIFKTNLDDMYHALLQGECEFMVTTVDSWNKQKHRISYNPQCSLERVGGERVVRRLGAGFATKADSGTLCTGFIRDVLNILMLDLKEDGFLDAAWKRERKRFQDMDCDTYGPELALANQEASQDDASRRRNLLRSIKSPQRTQHSGHHRGLKAGGGATGGAVATGSLAHDEDDERRLTPEQMIGTFVFHWGLMTIALFLASANALFKRHVKANKVVRAPSANGVSQEEATVALSVRPESDRWCGQTVHKDDRATVRGAQDIQDQMDSMQQDLRSLLEEMKRLKQKSPDSSYAHNDSSMAGNTAWRGLDDSTKIAIAKEFNV